MHMGGTLRRMLSARKWRGEKLTLSEFPEQTLRLAVTLEMVVVKNAGHYQVEPRDLFRFLGRPGEYLIRRVDGKSPANIFARANKVRKRNVRDQQVVVRAEPEVDQREVAAITTAVSPGEKTPSVPPTEDTLDEDTHEAAECDSPVPKPKRKISDGHRCRDLGGERREHT